MKMHKVPTLRTKKKGRNWDEVCRRLWRGKNGNPSEGKKKPNKPVRLSPCGTEACLQYPSSWALPGGAQPGVQEHKFQHTCLLETS
jgi:hypothetical protein